MPISPWKSDLDEAASVESFKSLSSTGPSWTSFTPEDISFLARIFTVIHLEEGEVAVVQDQLVSFVAIILSGNLKVIARPASAGQNDPSRPPNINNNIPGHLNYSIGSGHVLGEYAFFSSPEPCKRNGWVISEGDSYLAVATFEQLFQIPDSSATKAKLLYTLANLSFSKQRQQFGTQANQVSESVLRQANGANIASWTTMPIEFLIIKKQASKPAMDAGSNVEDFFDEFLDDDARVKAGDSPSSPRSKRSKEMKLPANLQPIPKMSREEELETTIQFMRGEIAVLKLGHAKALKDAASNAELLQISNEEVRQRILTERELNRERMELKDALEAAKAAAASSQKESKERILRITTLKEMLVDYRVCFRFLQRAFFRKCTMVREFLQDVFLKCRKILCVMKTLANQASLSVGDAWQFDDDDRKWLGETPLSCDFLDRIRVIRLFKYV
jgi:hypothetical protein